MYQTFEQPADPTAAKDKLTDLRRVMRAANVDAYLVPRADAHQGEYVAARSERLKWLTGFSGSAGAAVITTRKAAVFVDGRYTVQVGLETDASLFDAPGLARSKLVPWLTDTLKAGATVGFDPWLVTISDFERMNRELAAASIRMKPLARNLVDQVWGIDRPVDAAQPITVQPLKYAGEPAEDKIARVQATLKDSGADYAVLTQPDSIAWLLNIRGGDIPHTPVPLAFVILPATNKPELFITADKLTTESKTHLKALVKVQPPERLRDRLRACKQKNKVARIDTTSAAYWFARTLGARKNYVSGRDPCLPLKAIKNTAEIRGSRNAHLRDGAALVQFLAWLDAEAGKTEIDEITVVKKLEACRAETKALKEISFDTISGSGPNGAIVHYRVSAASNRKLKRGELLLVDSGAQYIDGTTDVTRTVAIGRPSPDMRTHYTLVLKGHIAIARTQFPKGTRGVDLDPFARRALWQHGLDYDHGTGHGIGSYLSVHEGPQSISRAGMVALEPGMILSNEPGYYKEGAYGIRIENLVLVKDARIPKGGERPMMSFESLTLVPFDRRLIDQSLLSADEANWINAYHKTVLDRLTDRVPGEARRWLTEETKPL
ncbi:MAG: aminopeptidase P family protein [Alphaproteobacteria bacterium]|nr:aminopeptidase P family protein [Alphaproteobacteria bacterium]